MALTDTGTNRIAPTRDAEHRPPRIWLLQYGPCWCRAEPGVTGSFDLVRFRTAEVGAGILDRDILIVSDRVIDGSNRLLRQVYEDVPAPNLVVATGHCPAARQFWDELPGGWSPVEELLGVDVRVRECISGYPEILLASILGALEANSHSDSGSVLTTSARGAR